MIRPGQDSDAPAMAKVLSDWIDATPWMPRIHTRDDDFGFCEGLLRRTDVWVADARQGVGFLALADDTIDALYLAPSIRGQGWGTALLDAVKPERTRLSLWCFQANRAAQTFYRWHGFHVAEVTDGRGNAEKLPDCLMVWERNAP